MQLLQKPKERNVSVCLVMFANDFYQSAGIFYSTTSFINGVHVVEEGCLIPLTGSVDQLYIC